MLLVIRRGGGGLFIFFILIVSLVYCGCWCVVGLPRGVIVVIPGQTYLLYNKLVV